MNVRNRWFLILAGLLSAVLVFGAACGGDDDDAGDNTPTAGETADATTGPGDGGEGQAPADQQKLTATSTAPQFVDPHKSNFEQDIALARMLWRGLYNLADDGEGGVEVVPDMADGEPTVSGTEYTVKIKPGQEWSDGQPVTAADFVYGLTRACDPEVAAPYQYILGAGLLDLNGCDALTQNQDPAQREALIAALGATAPDDSTLVLSLGRTVPNFTTLMSLWITYPAREDVVSANPDTWSNPETIVANGPFTMTAFTPGNGGLAVMAPNPGWQGKQPALQEVTIRFIDNLASALTDFPDQIHLTAIQPTDVSAARDRHGDQIQVDPGARITAVEVQMEDETLDDFNVRLALSRAIDREELVRVVYDDVHTVAHYWTAQGIVGHLGDEPFEGAIGFDVEAAKSALSEAGFPDGAGFPAMGILLTDSPTNRDFADYLVKAWQDNLGITVTPEFVDGDTRSDRFNAEDFQLLPGGWQSDYPDIENFIVGLFDTPPPPPASNNNKYNCSLPEIDAAITAGGQATDNEARIEAYQEAEREIVDNLCGAIPIYQNGRPWAIDDSVGGVIRNGVLDASMPGSWCTECWFIKAD